MNRRENRIGVEYGGFYGLWRNFWFFFLRGSYLFWCGFFLGYVLRKGFERFMREVILGNIRRGVEK